MKTSIFVAIIGFVAVIASALLSNIGKLSTFTDDTDKKDYLSVSPKNSLSQLLACGNGKKDLDEYCDPTDQAHVGWGNKGCNEKCAPITGPECDLSINSQLRHGHNYSFNDYLNNKSNYSIKIKKINSSFTEKENYNGDKLFPKFIQPENLRKSSGVIEKNKNIKIIATKKNTEYKVIFYPKLRAYNNIRISHKVYFTKIIDGKEAGYFNTTDCINYEITRCSDGIIDNYIDINGIKIHESCDDGNILSNDGCSKICIKE